MADIRPHRGMHFLCPCGCDGEYDVPIPDGWLLVPDDLDDAAMKDFDDFVRAVSQAGAYQAGQTARAGVRAFLRYYGSTTAKGVPTNG